MHRHGLIRSGFIRLDQIHERTVGVTLNDCVRQQRRVLNRVHEQPRVDELIREQRFVGVGENRLELDCARGRINLVVHSQQSSRRQFFGLRAVERVHGQRISRRQLLLDLRQVVFRDVENHGNRLQLRDDHQRRRVARVNDVARIH